MNPLDQLKSLNGKLLLLAGLGFLATIGPGLLTLDQFKSEYVSTFDLGKLVVLALAVALPPLLVNIITIGVMVARGRSLNYNSIVLLASLITAVEHYAALLIARFWVMTFNSMAFSFVVLLVLGNIVLFQVRNELQVFVENGSEEKCSPENTLPEATTKEL